MCDYGRPCVGISHSREWRLKDAADEFDVGEDVVYLNCAGRSPMPRSVQEAGEQAVGLKRRPWLFEDSDAQANEVRALASRLVGGAKPEDVALCPSTSFAFTALARCVAPRVEEGSHVVVLEDEMSSSVLPLQELAAARGAKVFVAPRPRDGDWTPALLRGDGGWRWDKVAVLSLPQAHWIDGSVVDLSAIADERRVAVPYDAPLRGGARCFDGGGRPNPVILPMVRAGLELVLAWEVSNIDARLRELTGPHVRRLGERFDVPRCRASGLVGVRPRGLARSEADAWADAAAAALKHRAPPILVTGRFGAVRVGALYNSDDDLEAFVDALFAFDDDYYVRRGYGRPAKPATKKRPRDADADSGVASSRP
ncbi:Aminotransferase class-V [Aureococcus anophagefferens]|nr:Aminotransferase class-V [Aureococcus anophagefferens]